MINELDSNLEREFHGLPELPHFIQFPSKVINLGFDRAVVLGIIYAYTKGALSVCKLKNETIANMIGRSKSNVSHIISDLDKAGFIKINIERNKNGTYRFITIPDAVYTRISYKREEVISDNIGGYLVEDIQKNNKDNNKDNNKENNNNKERAIRNEIPEFDSFLQYAKSKEPNIDPSELKLKYDSWLESDWSINRSGKYQKIVYWKSTLLNTLPYIKKLTVSSGPQKAQRNQYL